LPAALLASPQSFFLLRSLPSLVDIIIPDDKHFTVGAVTQLQ
jgi:hypothetical protein